ncbi:MAG: hypothetical protein ACPGVT_09145, partial [Maricaulaceae bacterium]
MLKLFSAISLTCILATGCSNEYKPPSEKQQIKTALLVDEAAKDLYQTTITKDPNDVETICRTASKFMEGLYDKKDKSKKVKRALENWQNELMQYKCYDTKLIENTNVAKYMTGVEIWGQAHTKSANVLAQKEKEKERTSRDSFNHCSIIFTAGNKETWHCHDGMGRRIHLGLVEAQFPDKNRRPKSNGGGQTVTTANIEVPLTNCEEIKVSVPG